MNKEKTYADLPKNLNSKKMKTKFTIIQRIIFYVLIAFPLAGYSQFAPGLPANFGIDGDVISGQSQNISGSTPQGSFDWFKATGSGSIVGLGIIDTTGTGSFTGQIASGADISFSKGMAFSMYSSQNGYLLLDAHYGRDNFGYSSGAGQSDSTIFTGGSKNGSDPATWTTAPGGASVTAKSDIIDSYVAMLRDGTTINSTNPSHLIMTMGVSTVGNTGNRYVDFELYRSRIAYNPSTGLFSNSGPSSTGGHTSWVFNKDGSVNSIGDLTVSFTYGTAGVSAISVYIWVSNSDFNNITPLNFNFVSGGFNGSTYGYGQIAPTGINPFNAWGSISSATTIATPWGTNSKALGGSPSNYYSANYAANDFGEVALDLTSMGVDPALSVGMNPCAPPYTRVIIKSRSSASFTSALQDFSGPYVFLDAPVASAQITSPAILKCNITTAILSAAIVTSGATYQWTTSDGGIVSSATSTSITVNKPGEYYLKSATVAGCPTGTDSIYVGADYFKPVATASATGVLITGAPAVTVTLNGGDTTASKYSSIYGSSTGLTWSWSGPDGFSDSTQNPVTNQVGTYTLVVTELSNGCKDTAVISLLSYRVLPVKIITFKALVLDNKSVNLQWVTGFEQNNSYFEVQRSFDSQNFTTIGIEASQANSAASQKIYQYNDKSPELQGKTMVYYRLKQAGTNENASYTKVLAVTLKSNEALALQISPNPFMESLTIRFNAASNGTAELNILNASGQIILSKKSNIGQGYNNIPVDGITNLSSGLYIARLTMNGTVISNQTVIKR